MKQSRCRRADINDQPYPSYEKKPGKRLRQAARATGFLAFPALHRWLGASPRVIRHYQPEAEQRLTKRRPVIFAWWHEYELALLPHGAEPATTTLLLSPSDDGEILAKSAKAMGYQVIYGSSRRGGKQAMQAMRGALGAGRQLVITPDGPMGPKHVVKPGILRLASSTNTPIVPITARFSRYRRLGGWDRLIIPLRPRQIDIFYHAPCWLAGDAGDVELANAAQQLAQTLSQ